MTPYRSPVEGTLSKSSYVAVRFEHGPRANESGEYRGEPPRQLAVRDHLGHYVLEWDRDDDGAKLRTGVYTWTEGEAVEPRDGDEASAALAEADKGARRAPAREPEQRKPAQKAATGRRARS